MNSKAKQRWSISPVTPLCNMRRVRRSGTSIMIVLFFMTFGMALIVGLLTFSLRQQRQLARQLQAEQATWLVDAGLGHAIDRLANNPKYQGETMLLELPVNNYSRAAVTIAVSKDHSGEQHRIIVTSTLVAAEGAESTVRKSIQVLGSR